MLVREALAPGADGSSTGRRRSHRHNLEQRLPVADTDDELAHLSVVLNQMIARLDEAFQHSRRFSADASHELRTPLTIMRVELESISQEQGLDAATREKIASILEETERMGKMVEGLLAISRLDTGEAVINVSQLRSVRAGRGHGGADRAAGRGKVHRHRVPHGGGGQGDRRPVPDAAGDR